jgi:hypothetical protein
MADYRSTPIIRSGQDWVHPGGADNRIDMREYARIDVDWPTAAAQTIRSEYRRIGITTAIVLALALVYLLVATPLYSVHAVIAPSDEQSNMLSASSIGKTLGLKTGGSGSPDYYDEFMRSLISEPVAEEMSRRGWLQVIFKNSWDAACKCWKHPALGTALSGGKAFLFGGPGWQPPGPYALYQFMKSHIRFVPVAETDMEDINFEYKDPEVGRRFLTDAIQIADGAVRRRSQARAQTERAYLMLEYQKTPDVEFRSMILTLVMDQERALATIAAPEMYSGRLVISATATPRPDSPDIMLVLIGALFGGATIGFVIEFSRTVRTMYREKKKTGSETVRG